MAHTRLRQTWAVVFACIIVFSSEAIKSIIIQLTISPPLMSYTHACLKRFLRVGVYVQGRAQDLDPWYSKYQVAQKKNFNSPTYILLALN